MADHLFIVAPGLFAEKFPWPSNLMFQFALKFIYSEKAAKFCEIYTLDLSYVVPVKSVVEISQNFVAFLEYMNFMASNTFADVIPTLKVS